MSDEMKFLVIFIPIVNVIKYKLQKMKKKKCVEDYY